jgi:hypothetical protein
MLSRHSVPTCGTQSGVAANGVHTVILVKICLVPRMRTDHITLGSSGPLEKKSCIQVFFHLESSNQRIIAYNLLYHIPGVIESNIPSIFTHIGVVWPNFGSRSDQTYINYVTPAPLGPLLTFRHNVAT